MDLRSTLEAELVRLDDPLDDGMRENYIVQGLDGKVALLYH